MEERDEGEGRSPVELWSHDVRVSLVELSGECIKFASAWTQESAGFEAGKGKLIRCVES